MNQGEENAGVQWSGAVARKLAQEMIHTYFTTQYNPLTKHHLESYNQFLKHDLPSMLTSSNPKILLKTPIKTPSGAELFQHKIEIYMGGKDGKKIYIGKPTISLQNGEDVRALLPNEARLRNMTYEVNIEIDIEIDVTYTRDAISPPVVQSTTYEKVNLCKLPLMLHSEYCHLYKKPETLLTEMGECSQDQGGYFIVEGAEKVLITRQQGAFNTLYITKQERDPKNSHYAYITSLDPKTFITKKVSFFYTREILKQMKGAGKQYKFFPSTLNVSIPYVRKEIPVFLLFRALGVQSDKDIMELIFPDMESPEAKFLADLLIPSIGAAYPFLDTYSAIQYIKSLTKGRSEFHVLDIIHNQLFPHVEDSPMSRVTFLADCVRSILRVIKGIDQPTDKDDTRNQRLLTSGFLVQQLFQNAYKKFDKGVDLAIDEEYNKHQETYSGAGFINLFSPGNVNNIFKTHILDEIVMRGFKGKWLMASGDEEVGILQAMSRLSYLDFMSHCRRVVLDFDTSLKLTGPRLLKTTQYGYFCTSETPTGSHIGLTKNLSISTAASLGLAPEPIIRWLQGRCGVYPCEDMTPSYSTQMVPVYLNGGIVGYTDDPKKLNMALKLCKRTAFLPPFTSVAFSIRQRRITIYTDAGRPTRPLIICHEGRLPAIDLFRGKQWTQLVVGSHPARNGIGINENIFVDPFEGKNVPSGQAYLDALIEELRPHSGIVEYLDPYEQNEALLANFPEDILLQTTHMEVHPSMILGLLGCMIPFPNHNQSPRNQLSASQSKQGLSIYATNWRSRYDNNTHVLCYGEAPLTRTLYQDYIGSGIMSYGHNAILAMGIFTGYNQEDGIVMNKDSFQRGMYRNLTYRSYETFEDDDMKAGTKTRIGNPKYIPEWMELNPALDYTKLDENGVVRIGEYVDENTVIVGKYLQVWKTGKMRDASLTPQVWTHGRVEDVVILVNNLGLRTIKIRVVQDRTPELGDKFCLTADHEVLTLNHGWLPIAQVTKDEPVAQRDSSGFLYYEKPYNVVKFPNDGKGNLTTIVSADSTSDLSLKVTDDHRLWMRYTSREPYSFIQTKDISKGMFYMEDEKNQEVSCKIGYIEILNEATYCLQTTSQTFYVRRKGTTQGIWTGNSNRHGQKGTLGMAFPACDLPRTKEGIVPDMMMNPHAIPSRMTMGQILEMITGKVAAQVGAVGNGTAFMNEGSPHEELGKVLEEYGFQKYGNEILYDGQTGQQIPADIYMGPVYGMRLKHMTEDKWNARGQGRKEQRTHQPTGGRGNQGGLKIGEMERDAILGHAISSFIRESMMERSDGTEFIVCNGCGTIPIYNTKQDLYICSLCDGPIEYSGNHASNFEPIPPVKRSITSFSKVEMPYATKLFFQELNTYLNMGIRILTSKDTTHLRSAQMLKDMDEDGEAVQVLPERVLPEAVEPKMVQNVPVVRNMTTPLPQATEVPPQIPEMDGIERSMGNIPRGENMAGERLATNPIIPSGNAPPASIVTAEDGTKVISVDVSNEAMRNDGLPGDGTTGMPPLSGPDGLVTPVPTPMNATIPAPEGMAPPPPPSGQQGGDIYEGKGEYSGDALKDAMELHNNSYATPPPTSPSSLPEGPEDEGKTSNQGPIRVIKIG
jgi:DNA-directed RNA polymerase II subunit RPB2